MSSGSLLSSLHPKPFLCSQKTTWSTFNVWGVCRFRQKARHKRVMETPRHAFYFPRVIAYSTCTPPWKNFVQVQIRAFLVDHHLGSKNCSEEEHIVLLLPPELQQTMCDNQKAQISVVMSSAVSTKSTSAHLRISINIICSHSLYLLHTKTQSFFPKHELTDSW